MKQTKSGLEHLLYSAGSLSPSNTGSAIVGDPMTGVSQVTGPEGAASERLFSIWQPTTLIVNL